MIQPSIGRVVWYHPARNDSNITSFNGEGPLAAIVTHVWSGSCVNLVVFDSNGVPHSRTSVLLVQDDEPARPAYNFCEWMPYQKGQAAKTEKLESLVVDLAKDAQPLRSVPELAAFGTAPRITPQDIKANIASEHYFTAAEGANIDYADADAQSLGLLTFCVIVLRNGFTVTGESACVSPENFDAEIGKKVARQNAVQQIWPLMGYALKDRMHNFMDRTARVCHEVNRAYCQALGDHSQPAWEDAPEWQRASARMGVDLHCMGDFGPEASHIAWMRNKTAEGWKYGPVKDAEKKEHPCMVPFGELPREQQAKDFIFRAVVHALKHGT